MAKVELTAAFDILRVVITGFFRCFYFINSQILLPYPKLDGFVKSPKTPSPLMGEGWGEGEISAIPICYIPFTLILSRQGRRNRTFYEFIKFIKGLFFADYIY